MVVLFHYTMSRDQADLGFKLGTTGVDLFFIISGFVILMSLEHIERSRQFIINRVSRLYPTYWACVTITFLVLLMDAIYKGSYGDVSIPQFLGNMTMFQFYLGISDLDAPYWTMILEMIFYIFMMILFHFKVLKRLNEIGILMTISIALMVHFQFDNIWVRRLFYWIPFLQFWPLFFMGTLFYKLITKNVNQFRYYGMAVVCLFSQIVLFKHSGRSNHFIDSWEYALMLLLYFSLFVLFVRGRLKFVINKPLLFLGKISFALYLIHYMISCRFIIPILTEEMNLSFWLSSAVALFCSIILAVGITYFIEVPYSKKMRTKLYQLYNRS